MTSEGKIDFSHLNKGDFVLNSLAADQALKFGSLGRFSKSTSLRGAKWLSGFADGWSHFGVGQSLNSEANQGTLFSSPSNTGGKNE